MSWLAEGLLRYMAGRYEVAAIERTVDAVDHTATAIVYLAAGEWRTSAAETMDALGALWDVAQCKWHAGRLTRAAARAAGSTSGTGPERRIRVASARSQAS